MRWQQFVIDFGWRARGDHLAHILGQPEAEILRLRQRQVCRRLQARLEFAELFAKWHGRPPADEEWPKPRLQGARKGYEWLGPELALLARLVGTMPVPAIAAALTQRLQAITGDATAVRPRLAIQNHLNDLGLQAGVDLVGGLTTREAGKRVGRISLIHQAIYSGRLKTIRVGKRHLIPLQEFERWLATREEPPAGWVRLASLMEPLGIGSDAKLPEYASLGYIPDVRLVRGIGTMRGVWFIRPERAKEIIAAAKDGRPLPWYGKPLPGNVRMMWNKWQKRRHRACEECTRIWSGAAPETFDEFSKRYGALTLGQKRHLTITRQRRRPSRPYGTTRALKRAGITVYEAARQLQQPSRWIRNLIRIGLFAKGGIVRDPLGGEAVRITPLGMSMLRAAAAAERITDLDTEWLGVHRAANLAGVSITTVHKWRQLNEVHHKPGPRGIVFERSSIERRARQHWQWAVTRFKRAEPPAWLKESAA